MQRFRNKIVEFIIDNAVHSELDSNYENGQEKRYINSWRNSWIKVKQTIENKCISRIYGHGKGWVFSQKDFTDLAARNSIDWAFHNLERRGLIRRIIRGIYDYPRESSLIGCSLAPDIQEIAKALSRKYGWRLQPSGETALNLLGWSNQVPGRYVFFSDGPSKKLKIGPVVLEFQRRSLRDSRIRSPKSMLLIQALKALGRDHLDDDILRKIRKVIDKDDCKTIIKDTRYVTDWVHQAIREACESKQDE